MVGSRAREVYDKLAEERMKSGKKSDPSANLREGSVGRASEQAGKAVGVSGRTIDFATKVLKHGTPDLVKAVDEGRVAASTAAVCCGCDSETRLSWTSEYPRHHARTQPGASACVCWPLGRQAASQPGRRGAKKGVVLGRVLIRNQNSWGLSQNFNSRFSRKVSRHRGRASRVALGLQWGIMLDDGRKSTTAVVVKSLSAECG